MLKSILGKKHPTLRDISVDFLIDILENCLKDLNLLGTSIGTSKTIPERLCAVHGPFAGIYYTGLHYLNLEMPNKAAIAEVMKKHPKTIDRQLKKVIEAGVPLTVTDNDEPLPPLTIDKDMIRKMAGVSGLSQ